MTKGTTVLCECWFNNELSAWFDQCRDLYITFTTLITITTANNDDDDDNDNDNDNDDNDDNDDDVVVDNDVTKKKQHAHSNEMNTLFNLHWIVDKLFSCAHISNGTSTTDTFQSQCMCDIKKGKKYAPCECKFENKTSKM